MRPAGFSMAAQSSSPSTLFSSSQRPISASPLRILLHFHFSYLLPLLIAYVDLVQAVSPIHSYVVSFHCLLLLRYVIPIPIALNGKLALYRSSRRGLLSIEPLFRSLTGWDSLSQILKNGIGLEWSSTSKLLKSVSHKHELLYVNLQRC